MKGGTMMELAQLQDHELLSIFMIREAIDHDKIDANQIPDKKQLYQEIRNRYLNEFPNTNPSLELLELYLRKKGRYPLLNALIKRELNKLVLPQQIEGETIDETDSFFFYNMKALLPVMKKQGAVVLQDLMEKEETMKEKIQVKLPYHQLQQYIIELLTELDPTLEYVDFYLQSLADEYIIYIQKEDDLKKRSIIEKLGLYQYGISIASFPMNCCIEIDGQPYLIMEQKNMLDDFSTFFHEFAHYYSKSKKAKNQKPSNSLAEYFSITYEFYTFMFLRKKGYSKEVLEQMQQPRNQNTYAIGTKLFDLFYYMSTYIEKGSITEEGEIQRQEELIKIQRETFTKEYLEVLETEAPECFHPVLSANLSCDLCIEGLIKNQLSDWYYEYPYLVGQVLATKTIELIQKNQFSIGELKKMMENADFLDPYDVFVKLGFSVEDIGLCSVVKREKTTNQKAKLKLNLQKTVDKN